jgi:ABC-type transporter MlaC component
MKSAVILSLLFAALIASPASAHTSAASMLKDAAVNHDLIKIKQELAKFSPDSTLKKPPSTGRHQ